MMLMEFDRIDHVVFTVRDIKVALSHRVAACP
jgi:hypothetical protein